MKQDKIVVVMGGTSTEAEVSRRTGAAILAALQEKGYNAEGMELNPKTFAMDIQKAGAKMVFNALHGKFGEDGLLQGTLDMLGEAYHQLRHKGGRLRRRLCLHRQGEGDVQGVRGEAQEVQGVKL